MNDRTPVTTLADLDALDDREIVAGYWSGYAGDPEPGNNHSRAYWHGWRNGAADGKHREIDEAQRVLAHAIVEDGRMNRLRTPTFDLFASG
jgi:hypothetical protein